MLLTFKALFFIMLSAVFSHAAGDALVSFSDKTPWIERKKGCIRRMVFDLWSSERFWGL